jgi:hypothetical protein
MELSLPFKGRVGVGMGVNSAFSVEGQYLQLRVGNWKGGTDCSRSGGRSGGPEGTGEIPSGLNCLADRLLRRSGNRCGHDTRPGPRPVLALVPHADEGISGC